MTRLERELEILLHAPATQGDALPLLLRELEDLGHPRDVRGEHRDEGKTFGGGEKFIERCVDFGFGMRMRSGARRSSSPT